MKTGELYTDATPGLGYRRIRVERVTKKGIEVSIQREKRGEFHKSPALYAEERFKAMRKVGDED